MRTTYDLSAFFLACWRRFASIPEGEACAAFLLLPCRLFDFTGVFLLFEEELLEGELVAAVLPPAFTFECVTLGGGELAGATLPLTPAVAVCPPPTLEPRIGEDFLLRRLEEECEVLADRLGEEEDDEVFLPGVWKGIHGDFVLAQEWRCV